MTIEKDTNGYYYKNGKRYAPFGNSFGWPTKPKADRMLSKAKTMKDIDDAFMIEVPRFDGKKGHLVLYRTKTFK